MLNASWATTCQQKLKLALEYLGNSPQLSCCAWNLTIPTGNDLWLALIIVIFIRCIQKECDCQDKEEIELSFNRSVAYSFMTTICTLMDALTHKSQMNMCFSLMLACCWSMLVTVPHRMLTCNVTKMKGPLCVCVRVCVCIYVRTHTSFFFYSALCSACWLAADHCQSVSFRVSCTVLGKLL